MSRFNIPAISLLVNDVLNPHYDSLNPTNEQYDRTLSITVHVPLKSLSSVLQDILKESYDTHVPFCIVMHQRQCLVTLRSLHFRIDEYKSKEHKYHEAREKIIKILSDGVYSELDYGGLFFTRHRQRLIDHKFDIIDGSNFNDKMAVLNEAVDKCGFWSCLLHVFYTYCYIKEVHRDDILSFLLFFGHQCNSTVLIVQAMVDLLHAPARFTKGKSLYYNLAKQCKLLKDSQLDKDVGCGKFARFSPSDTKTYNETEVIQNCNSLNRILGDASTDFQQLSSSRKISPLDCFECFERLKNKLIKFSGIGNVKASHLIQLSSLLGIIPLQFYAYLPAHADGGTGKFFENEFGYNYGRNTSAMFQQYSKDFASLQDLYGLNFTSNMFENMACILGRGRVAKDVYYYLPWVMRDSEYKPCLCQVPEIQLTFRLKVQDITNISLQCKSNGPESTVLRSSFKKSVPSINIIKYNKVKKNGVLMLSEEGHAIDKHWMESQYDIPGIGYLNDNKIFENIKLPSYEHFYNEVCDIETSLFIVYHQH